MGVRRRNVVPSDLLALRSTPIAFSPARRIGGVTERGRMTATESHFTISTSFHPSCRNTCVLSSWTNNSPHRPGTADRAATAASVVAARNLPSTPRTPCASRICGSRPNGWWPIASLRTGEFSQTLDMIARAFPCAAFLYHRAGRLLWGERRVLARRAMASNRDGRRAYCPGRKSPNLCARDAFARN